MPDDPAAERRENLRAAAQANDLALGLLRTAIDKVKLTADRLSRAIEDDRQAARE